MRPPWSRMGDESVVSLLTAIHLDNERKEMVPMPAYFASEMFMKGWAVLVVHAPQGLVLLKVSERRLLAGGLMFKLRNLFGSGKDSEEIISMKLESPVVKTPASTGLEKTLAERMQERKEMQAAFDKSPMAVEVNRRMKQLMESGKFPKSLYYVNEPQNDAPL